MHSFFSYSEILLPQPPKSKLHDLEAKDKSLFLAAKRVISDLVDITISTGSSERQACVIEASLVRALDCGLAAIGVSEDGSLTMLMWHYTKGQYMTLTPDNFNTYEELMMVQFGNILMAHN